MTEESMDSLSIGACRMGRVKTASHPIMVQVMKYGYWASLIR
jgi:hypothetical protein